MNNDIGPTSHSYVSQRLRLHYLDWGNPDAPMLILVHGGQDHARSWDRVARKLRNDWHVIAPDLRGHGDSAWSPDGAYFMAYHVYDLAQLIHQLDDREVSIVGHSFGGAISLRYAGLYPEKVRRLVAIEGLGMSPKSVIERERKPVLDRWRDWIEERRGLAARQPRRYATIEEALARMCAENTHLTPEQARHLTIHGVSRNEDGSYSWKFDNYVRSVTPFDSEDRDLQTIWAAITCPVMLAWGRDSWASNPAEDGRAAYFRDARVVAFDNAGHWLHHDQFDAFMTAIRAFL